MRQTLSKQSFMRTLLRRADAVGFLVWTLALTGLLLTWTPAESEESSIGVDWHFVEGVRLSV